MAGPATLIPVVRGKWLPMSYDEFLAWAPDGMHTEWTDGEGIIYLPSVSTSDRHEWTISLLEDLLGEFVEMHGLGRVIRAPYAVKLSPDGPHREPDLIFVAADRLDDWTTTRCHGAPDLVIEVLSDDTASEDRGRKRAEYERAGAREYLMIDNRRGRREVEFLRLDALGQFLPVAPDERGRYHSAALPGFWIDPAWFTQTPLPKPMVHYRQVPPEGWRRLVAEVEGDLEESPAR